MPQPCKFWAQGNCKNGNNCRFEHIGPPGAGVAGGGRGGESRGGRGDYDNRNPPRNDYNSRAPSGGFGNSGFAGNGYQQPRDSYQPARVDSYQPGRGGRGGRGGDHYQPRDAYQGQQSYDNRMSDRDYYQDNRGRGKGRGRGRGGYHDDRRDHREPAKADQPELNQYRFNAQTLLADLTEELPIWPLSCFCPGVKAPVQLFGGEQRERSFEEMRLNHYELSAQGQEALAAQQQDELGQKAIEQNEVAKKNPEAAVAYILQGEKEHPNRCDIEDMYNRGEIDPSQPLPAEVVEIIHGALPSNVIPQAQAAPQPQVDAFGRPVSQPASTPNPFGTPNPAPPAPFGTPNPFGQSNGANPLQQPQFGTPQTQSSAPFGQSPAPFGQSAFGTPQQQNPFNAQQNPISPFVQQQPPQAQQPSPFGGFQQQAGPFGQPQQMATPPPSSFNSFDQGQGASNPSASASAGPERLPHHGKTISYNEPQFSDPGTGINPPAPTYERKTAVLAPIVGEFVNILTQKKETIKWADPSPYCPGCPVQHPHIDTYSTRDPATGKFSSFKGYPVEYKEITEENPLDFSDVTVVAPGYRVPPSAKWPQGLWIRIQFPNGPPAYNPETETSIYNAEDEKIWEEFNRTQKFPNDELPYNPPARELCHWAF